MALRVARMGFSGPTGRLVHSLFSGPRFASPTPEQIRFWLREIRTPEVLLEAVARHPGLAELEALRRGRQE